MKGSYPFVCQIKVITYRRMAMTEGTMCSVPIAFKLEEGIVATIYKVKLRIGEEPIVLRSETLVGEALGRLSGCESCDVQSGVTVNQGLPQ